MHNTSTHVEILSSLAEVCANIRSGVCRRWYGRISLPSTHFYQRKPCMQLIYASPPESSSNQARAKRQSVLLGRLQMAWWHSQGEPPADLRSKVELCWRTGNVLPATNGFCRCHAYIRNRLPEQCVHGELYWVTNASEWLTVLRLGETQSITLQVCLLIIRGVDHFLRKISVRTTADDVYQSPADDAIRKVINPLGYC